MLSRIQELEADISLDTDEPTLAIRLPDPPSCGREILRIQNGSIGYTFPLATGIDVRISKGAKIAVIGVNGIGKSTLLRTIAQRIPALSGEFNLGHNVELAYFAQEQLEVLDSNASAIQNVLNSSHESTERQARSLLGAFLFRGDEVFKPVRILSGGEKSRVGLARLLATKANFLLLDEPTNHLDMSSVETLAQAISEYAGTILYVSHDRTFIEETCTHVLVMLPDGRSSVFEGNLDDYQRLAAQSGFPNVLDAKVDTELLESTPNVSGSSNTLSAQNPDARAQELKRDRQKLDRAISKADAEMAVLAASITQLELSMIDGDSLDYNKARANHEEQEKLRRQLANVECSWMEYSERLESTLSELRILGRG
jgi:ATP-binding cassette subfamily F protein 3